MGASFPLQGVGQAGQREKPPPRRHEGTKTRRSHLTNGRNDALFPPSCLRAFVMKNPFRLHSNGRSPGDLPAVADTPPAAVSPSPPLHGDFPKHLPHHPGTASPVKTMSYLSAILRCAVVPALLSATLLPIAAADWPNWRGPTLDGASGEATLPEKLDASTQLWA